MPNDPIDARSPGDRRAWQPLVGLALIGALFFVAPIPHTITLRDVLMLAGLGWYGWLIYRRRPGASLEGLRIPVVLFAGLTLWIVIQALLLSPEPAWSLDEIRGQWFRSVIMLALGAAVVYAGDAQGRHARAAVAVVFAALLVHVLYADVAAMRVGIRPGELRFGGLTEGPDRLNYLTNILLALVFAEIVLRLRGDRLLPLGGAALAACVAALLFCVYIASARNGLVLLVLLTLVCAGFYFRAGRGRYRLGLRLGGMLGMVALALTLVATSFYTDNRWKDFMETLPLALDTEGHKEWLEWNNTWLVQSVGGKPVSESNYLRIAWLKEGSRLVLDRPLGYGFGRNVFGHALQEKYGKGQGHSHSGVLDLTLGAGVPGLLLWLGFLGSLIVLAYRRYVSGRQPQALALIFVVADFGARMFVDSVMRDHMLQQFLFLVGLLSAMTLTDRVPGRSPALAAATSRP